MKLTEADGRATHKLPSPAVFRQRHSPTFFLLLVIVILLVATATRLHLLDTQSLWGDEGNSYVQATRSFKAIADHAGRDIHPPGYYWLLAVWMKLVGEGEFALRALSTFASIISVAFTAALGTRLFGRLAGVTAAIFVALNTFSIYYAQEMRMYALLAMWSVAAIWFFVRFIRTPGKNSAIALGIVNAAGLYTQYAFPFVMLTQGMLFMLWVFADVRQIDRNNNESNSQATALLKYYVAANVLTLLLFAPWLPTAWRQITTWPNTGEPIPTTDALTKIIAYFAYGITVGNGTTIMVIFFLLFGLLVPPNSQRREWWRLSIPAIWVLLTVGLFLVMGLFREANLKLLLPAQLAFAIWMGRGVSILWHTKPRRTNLPIFRAIPKIAATVSVFALVLGIWDGLDALYHAPEYQRDNYREIVKIIEADLRPGDAIILAAPNQQEVFSYYYTGDAPIFPLPRGLGGDDNATLAEAREILRSYDRIFAILWGLDERDPNNIVENTLDSEAFEADSTWYGGVRLVRYVTPVEFATFHDSGVRFSDTITLEQYAISNEITINPGDIIQLQLIWSTNTSLDTRYKVFVQLLDVDGFLVAQRDAEPGGGLSPTISWQVNQLITDNHALIMPKDLPPSHYQLIIGLYNINDPYERLFVAGTNDTQDYLTITEIDVVNTPQ
jgi:mannosyltransferase